jgi:S-adenosyl-L-methionine hydrolase (adenosine-forming)
MIVLFTDFGVTGPYVGQMKAAINPIAPLAPIIDLFANAPSFSPVAAGYLLAAYTGEFSAGTVFLCVVDPGVGSSSRRPVVAEIDGCYFVGPDNGLLDVVAKRACFASKREILWQPPRLSATFHGRDLFALVAARVATNTLPKEWLADAEPFDLTDVADELAQLIYIDGYGNAMTGIRAAVLDNKQQIEIDGRQIGWARTFADVERGTPFWYENANGLVEIAVNCGSAAAQLSLSLGDEVKIV